MSKSLRELANIEYGASPKEIRADYKTQYKIFGTGGLVGYSVLPLFEEPIIVVARKGTLDKPIFSEDSCWVIDTAFAVIPKKDVDAKWLYYQLVNFDLKKLNEATGVPSINREFLYRVNFEKPSLNEQRRISHILSIADSVIDKIQCVIEKYDAIKQGMLQDLFTRGIDLKTGKLRPRYEDAPELYKKSKLGWIPKEWDVEMLQKCCDRISVGIATSSSYYFEKEGILFLRNQNIKENKIDLSDIIYISKDFADANASKYLKKGDVITVRTGYPGTSAVVGSELENSQTFTTLITTPNKKILDSYYLSYFLNSDFGKVQVLNLQGGGAQQNLNSGALETMLITKPKINEQKQIVDRLISIDKNIDSEQNYHQKLQAIKQGLMSDLLSGKKRVKIKK